MNFVAYLLRPELCDEQMMTMTSEINVQAATRSVERMKWARQVLVWILLAGLFFLHRHMDSVLAVGGGSSPPSFHNEANSSSTKFENVWTELQNILCPNMVPRTEYGNTLFALARSEIGLKEWQGSEKERFFQNFFKLSQEGFQYVSSSNDHTFYVGIWKVAHQQILLWGNTTLASAKKKSHFERLDRLKLPKAIAQALHSNSKPPCIVTVIRDPVSHFVSGYNEMEFRLINDEARMREAPVLLFHRYKEGSKQRFEQFVADFLGGPAHEGWKVRIEPAHLYSMSNVLTMLSKQAGGANITSYLPSIDDIVETWPRFVYDTCPGIPASVLSVPMVVTGQHQSSLDPYGTYKAAKAVFAEGGPTARALCAIHALDYACWDKLPNGIPTVCKDVYSNPQFLNGIRQQRDAIS